VMAYDYVSQVFICSLDKWVTSIRPSGSTLLIPKSTIWHNPEPVPTTQPLLGLQSVWFQRDILTNTVFEAFIILATCPGHHTFTLITSI
jgi:hypothetical protein